MYDLWSEASRDVAEENAIRRLHSAKARVAGTWAFLANAQTTSEFAQRKDLAVEALADAVWAVTEDADEAEDTWKRLHASLDEDFEVIVEARKITSEKEARQTRARECPECGNRFKCHDYADTSCPACGNEDCEDTDAPKDYKARDYDFDDSHAYASRHPFDTRRVTAYNDAEESQASSEHREGDHPLRSRLSDDAYPGTPDHDDDEDDSNRDWDDNGGPDYHGLDGDNYGDPYGKMDAYHDFHNSSKTSGSHPDREGGNVFDPGENRGAGGTLLRCPKCGDMDVHEVGTHASCGNCDHLWRSKSASKTAAETNQDQCGICGTRLTNHRPATQHPESGNWSMDEHDDENGEPATGGPGNRNGGHWHRPAEIRPPVTNPAVHTFDSTGEAYDSSQTEDHIKDGDVLSVPSEGVHGYLHHAWPVAVVHPDNPGAFHVFGDNEGYHEDRGRYETSKAKAREVGGEGHTAALNILAVIRLTAAEGGGYIIVDEESGYKVGGPYASHSDAEAVIASGKFEGKHVKVEKQGEGDSAEEDAHKGGRGNHDESGGSKPFDDKGHHKKDHAASRHPFGSGSA